MSFEGLRDSPGVGGLLVAVDDSVCTVDSLVVCSRTGSACLLRLDPGDPEAAPARFETLARGVVGYSMPGGMGAVW